MIKDVHFVGFLITFLTHRNFRELQVNFSWSFDHKALSLVVSMRSNDEGVQRIEVEDHDRPFLLQVLSKEQVSCLKFL